MSNLKNKISNDLNKVKLCPESIYKKYELKFKSISIDHRKTIYDIAKDLLKETIIKTNLFLEQHDDLMNPKPKIEFIFSGYMHKEEAVDYKELLIISKIYKFYVYALEQYIEYREEKIRLDSFENQEVDY